MDAESELQIFRKALPQRIRLREISQLIGRAKGKVCLDAGFDNGIMSRTLRKQDGAWQTLVRDPARAAQVSAVLGDKVSVFDGKTLPYPDKTFDIVVLSGLLEHVQDDNVVITECHRVLKPAALLIVDVRHAKRWSIINTLESTLGLTPQRLALAREGYSESQLFHLLKGGFDVHALRSYSGIFTQLVDVLVRHQLNQCPPETRDEQAVGIYSRAFPLYWIAFQLLDVLAVFTKGYRLLAYAKRHAWHSREPPVLNDGRSLPDVVVSRIRG